MKARAVFFSLLLFVITGPCAAGELSHPNKAEAARLDETSCADGFSFAVVADSHNSPVFDVISGLVRAMRPDFAVSVGDETNNGREDEYAQFLNRITAAGVPWFVAPGNHEYRSPEGHTTLDGRKRFESIFGNSDFVFDHCGWRFIGLDVVAFDMLRNEQIVKLEKALQGHEGRAVVFMHYPPAVIKNWEQGYWKANADAFLALLEKYEVRYFFSGHIHVYDRLDIGPTRFIVTGGGGLDTDVPPEKYNAPEGGAFHHFIYVAVDGGRAVDSVVRPEIPGQPAPQRMQ